ncbi:MAG: methyltransferase domain-containing protein [Acidobacteria bacterium]|nr:MAG: methyltransferase domain-containing protein [Acidobacteriota bacterium]
MTVEHVDWLERWREGRTPFHMDRINPWLERFAHHLDLGPGRRVLVPLCGMSLDLGYLARQGGRVMGVDLAEEALRRFLERQPRKIARQERGDAIFLLAAPYTLVAADIMTMTREQFGMFDAIWDRAALVALPQACHAAYVGLLLSLLKPEGRILMVSIEYDTALMDGPPFSLPAQEIKDLFRGSGQVEVLAEQEVDADEPIRVNHNLPWVKESVFLIAARDQ